MIRGARAYNQRCNGLSYPGGKSYHFAVQLARLQDFKPGSNSQVGLSVATGGEEGFRVLTAQSCTVFQAELFLSIRLIANIESIRRTFPQDGHPSRH